MNVQSALITALIHCDRPEQPNHDNAKYDSELVRTALVIGMLAMIGASFNTNIYYNKQQEPK